MIVGSLPHQGLPGRESSQHASENLGSNKYRFQVNNNHQPATTTATSSPLVLSLSQIQGSGGLLILNSGTHSPALAPVRSAKDKAESMEVTWWFMSPLALVLWWFPLSFVCFIVNSIVAYFIVGSIVVYCHCCFLHLLNVRYHFHFELNSHCCYEF